MSVSDIFNNMLDYKMVILMCTSFILMM